MCGEAHIIAEISDSVFVGERMALLCESYMNDMEAVYIVTDSFDSIVPGSPADAACSSHIRVLHTRMPELQKTISSAQYRRAWVIDAYLGAVQNYRSSVHHDGDTWVVLTEFDAWWEGQALCEYVHFLEARRNRNRDGIVIGGAGWGTLRALEDEQTDWASSDRTPRYDSMPYGAMTVVSLSDLRLIFGEGSPAGSAVAYQSRLSQTCFRGESEDQCDSTNSEVACGVLCQGAPFRYDGARFNNDHMFMACVADHASHSSRRISALWARPGDSMQTLFYIDKFIFQYDLIDDAEEAPELLQYENHVGAHHVSDVWLRGLISGRTRKTPRSRVESASNVSSNLIKVDTDVKLADDAVVASLGSSDEVLTINWTVPSGHRTEFVDVYVCASPQLAVESCTAVRSRLPTGPDGRGGVSLHVLSPFSRSQYKEVYKEALERARGVLERDAGATKPEGALLPSVLSITLPRRSEHFKEHIQHRLPEAVALAAWDGAANPAATANELSRLGVALSSDAFILNRRLIPRLHLNYSWSHRAVPGQVR